MKKLVLLSVLVANVLILGACTGTVFNDTKEGKCGYDYVLTPVLSISRYTSGCAK